MAGEIAIQTGLSTSTVLYYLIRNNTSQVWNTNTLAFENYLSANYANYSVAMVGQGVVSGYFDGTFPPSIIPGEYNISVLRQSGGSPTEGDPFVGGGGYQWNGQVTLALSFLATSGQVAGVSPFKIYRGEQILNFPFYLVSSLDHSTPFTSGVCSGQISRDGGAFTFLQSGIISEVGFGIFSVGLTSGDMLCNSAALRFTANGVSGGSSDARVFTLLTQKSPTLSGSF